jgi:S-DNA-T family DNA segregation ATPase FtsK/SpoIIIE
MITKDMFLKASKTMMEIAKSPHILIAGTTGSGKSVALNNLIYTLLLTQGNSSQFIFIDTKRVELKQYKRLPGCIDYVTEPEDVSMCLDNVISFMDKRYDAMEGKETKDFHLYIVIDELADLVDETDVIKQLVKIGRLGRAAHIHLLACTQDPSRHTLSAQLMQNFTARIALRCKDSIESRQVLGVTGAEKLPKYGFGILSDADGERKIKITLTPDEYVDEAVSTCQMMERFASGKYTLEDIYESGIKYSTDNEGYLTVSMTLGD